MAASTHPARPHGRGKEIRPMAGKAHGRDLRPNESQGLLAHQPATRPVSHNPEHGQLVYTWSRFCRRCLLRFRWLLEYAGGRGAIPLGQHPRRLRRRASPVEAHGVGFWLLAGDDLRLPVLPVHLRRDGDRLNEKLGHENVSGVDNPASGGGYYQLPGRWAWAATARCRPSRAVPGNLAGPSRESPIEPNSVFRPAH